MKAAVYPIILIFSYLQLSPSLHGQEYYHIRTIAFYNTENLFDTISSSVWDEDRSPHGSYRWTSERYFDKISKLAKVIAGIGRELTATAPDIVGLAEVENAEVLHHLSSHPLLLPYNYGIVHFDSPDRRGIDVALLYKKKTFFPISTSSIPLKIYDEEENRRYTRDQLLVSGILDEELIYFIVNHWPSRYGGEKHSRPHRLEAAKLNLRIIDSIRSILPEAKIISMGDLNDDPSDPSLKKVLKTLGKKKDTASGYLYNPMEELARKGMGSLGYGDRWHLFDQIFFTSSLLDTSTTSYRYWKAGIYNKAFLITPSGKYKGYPLRSYALGTYSGGYSDHFPVYLYLVSKKASP
ncbi:endonuclease/exonuclease/phosphatase family protein [Sinomicrobium sp.]